MKRLITVTLFAVLVMRLGAFAGPIPEPTPNLPDLESIAYRAKQTPIIDGDLSDWKHAAFKFIGEQEDVLRGNWGGPDDLSYVWSVMWDENAFYFAAAVRDDIYQEPIAGQPWTGDCLFLYIDANLDGTSDNKPCFFLLGGQPTVLAGAGGVQPGDVELAIVMEPQLGDAGRIFEVAIPLGSMKNMSPIEGGEFRMMPGYEEGTQGAEAGKFIDWDGLNPDDAANLRKVTFGGLIDNAGPKRRADNPSPADGALHPDTWVTLSWRAGDFAVSHDVYMGDNLDDVNEATRDSILFRGNQETTFYVAGFPGYAYPDGLVNGTTYYWRIDEVNEADPNSPWKGKVWSFMVPPKTAYFPDPADGAEFVALDAKLKWTSGFGAKLHTVYIGEDFDTVNEATGGAAIGVVSYTPGPLKLAKTYYWRVDEFDGAATYKGEVWSFTILGAVSGPNPADGAVDVSPTQALSWDAGAVAASHEVYFGTDAEAVKNATKSSPEYKGAKALGEESYAPGKLLLETTYYWRIDEVNTTNPDSPWAGNVWSFTTGDYFVIDDFEDYNAGDNQIWYAWHDGLGYGTPGTAGYYAGNGTGAAVGDESTPSYTEETIVHGGGQSMPVAYDNNKQGYSKYSEVELKLTDQRDWTEQGVAELSLWFRGYPGSVGSFVEGPAGTFTMTGSGADIWAVNGVEADQFHFAYKMLTGAGSIIAKVDSVQNTNGWAKAGVMIRESLNPDSAHAFACVTPANGVASQYRPSTGGTSGNYNQTGVAAPYWVKLERSISGLFTVSHSSNGTTWQPVMGAVAENIPMGSNVYIGLALTAHDAALTCQAVFSNVTTTGNVTGQWAHQDIGIASNAAEPLYVAVYNISGSPAVVVHDDPAAATIDTWTEWVIPLSAFADQGIVLTNVDRIAIGLGTSGNTTIPGGSGKMYFDDIGLYRTDP